MRLWITVVGSLASIAIGLFIARPYIRRLYAPPNGKRRLRVTWIGAVSTMAGSFLFDSDRAILALIVFVSGPAIALIAMLLCRDAYNALRKLVALALFVAPVLPWYLVGAGVASSRGHGMGMAMIAWTGGLAFNTWLIYLVSRYVGRRMRLSPVRAA